MRSMTRVWARTFGGMTSSVRDRFWLLSSLTLCLALDFCFARSILPNADTLQIYNEIPSIDAGNLLLRHWVLTSDNFYLTDLPIFVLVLLLTACVLLVRDGGGKHRHMGAL